MTCKELRAAARKQLNNKIFGNRWMYALLACVIYGAIIAAATGVVPGIGSLLVIGPMGYGLSYVFLKQARDGEEMNMGDLFNGFSEDFGGTFLLGLMTSIFVFLWALLFIIPGIIMSFAYSMAFYIKVDHPEYDWRQCIDESKSMMKGNKWRLFCLDLSFIGWWFVCIFTCGIGFLWLSPYMTAAKTQFYEDIKPAAAYTTYKDKED